MTDAQHLLLVPGLLCDATLWAHQAAHLGDLATIQIGETRLDDSIAGMAKRILDSPPPRFALAGLSMGGYVSFEILRRAPERVTKLALLDTSPLPDPPDRTAGRRELMQMTRDGRFEEAAATLLPLFIHEDRLDDAALCNAVAAMATAIGPEAFLRQQAAIIERVDSRPDLPGIRQKTLLVVGRSDALTPVSVHEEMATAIPDSRLAVIEDSGHLPTMERPQAVTVLLRDWLVN